MPRESIKSSMASKVGDLCDYMSFVLRETALSGAFPRFRSKVAIRGPDCPSVKAPGIAGHRSESGYWSLVMERFILNSPSYFSSHYLRFSYDSKYLVPLCRHPLCRPHHRPVIVSPPPCPCLPTHFPNQIAQTTLLQFPVP